ncbi:expressed unknown protein [Seminavis robusta]|uniref:Uncharacterized protein n=1 Tax=Seminavis robusta TaxID=568900 RepID=A0A9N8HDM9_9STRA|nr:expressed unknown protein [Seminavis robusta]|eukprot:Sro351_g123800.1 n/a (128) ;mRNA; f:1723-2106
MSDETNPELSPAVFHTIPLPFGDDDDDDDDDEKTFTKTAEEGSKTELSSTTGVLENAIQDCFQIAIRNHDAKSVEEVEKAVWHWNPSASNDDETPLDFETEKHALQTWVPRPLFLPSWAANNQGVSK